MHVVQKKGQNHSFAAAASAAHTDTISLEDISYLSTLIGFDGWLYALGKTQDGKTGSVILCRTQSHTGPIEKGPLLAKGMQHCEMHLVGNMAFVFYTLLGDTLERIFLATLELDSKVDWKQWSLLPGPTVLTPTHNIEQNASFISSKEGCRYSGSVEFNDPYLLRDDDEPDGHFRGTLFYAVQGMRAFAASRVDIQLKELFHYTCFRQKQLIADRIIEASSLAVDGYHKEMTNVIISPVLFTGTGRSGTTFLCKIFQVVGLNISHDNDIDCGHYPGTDGAASWFDAFVTEFHGKRRMYREVLHIVRNPIKVIASRVHRLEGNMSYVKGFHRLTSPWENTSDLVHIIESENYYTDRRDDAMKFSLKHWVRRNSFVGVVASWVEQIEQLSSDPMALWRLCMAAHFGPRCQTLEQWRQAMDNTSQTINTDMDKFKFANKEKRKVDWLELLRLEQMYSSIALKMSLDLGYEIPHEILPDYPYISELQYQCGFDQHGKWDCWY